MGTLNIDVCIAGSGPAGTIAARQLAQAGLSVMLIDRPAHKTHKFGETLPSAAIRLLNKLGLFSLTGQLQTASHSNVSHSERVGGNMTFWGSNILSTTDSIHDPYGFGLRIDRKHFDELLRKEALAQGTILYPSDVIALAKNNESWLIELEDGKMIQAKWVVDATGRSAKLIRLLGIQRHRGVPLVALYRTCTPEKNLKLNRTIISASQHGWIYAGKINDHQWVVGYHTTPKTATQFHHDAKQWQQIIRNNVGLYNLLGNFEFGKDVFSHDVRSSWLEQPMGQGWVACGDALLAFDPIAGQGLFNAIYTGMKAAETILSSTEYTHYRADYLTEINQIIKTYENRRYLLYKQEQRWSENPFWQAHQTITKTT
ncbi:MAG: NAD(P)/FAD-dependent oxidoreductase [Moraxellaceae bacterium]|nr:NAD(P)/FAD-dependent oxidoreductase [Moraxellaceae bacterium]